MWKRKATELISSSVILSNNLWYLLIYGIYILVLIFCIFQIRILKGTVNFNPAFDLDSNLVASAQLKRYNINAVKSAIKQKSTGPESSDDHHRGRQRRWKHLLLWSYPCHWKSLRGTCWMEDAIVNVGFSDSCQHHTGIVLKAVHAFVGK